MKPVLVIGDLIIDAYHYGKLAGTAPDFPTILAHQDTTKLSYGGAGLVVSNLLALGAPVFFLTMIGEGVFADYAKSYRHKNLKLFFVKDTKRVTTVKERYWVDGHKLLEWHHFDSAPISAVQEKYMLAELKKQLPQVDKVLVTDYRHGLLSERAAKTIVQLCRKARVPLYIDSQVVHAKSNHGWYKGASFFLLNAKEALHVDPQFTKHKLRASLERLQKMLGTKNVIVKLAADGSVALLDKKFIRSAPYQVHAVDPVGAGDAFVAALLSGKATPTSDDLRRANIWAALSTTLVGTEPPSRSDFDKALTLTTKAR